MGGYPGRAAYLRPVRARWIWLAGVIMLTACSSTGAAHQLGQRSAAGGPAAGSVAGSPAGGSPAAGAPAGGGAPSPTGPCGLLPAGRAHYTHVVWIWFENASFGQVVGAPGLGYLDRLAHACGVETDYHAIRHPSLPNYLAAATGNDPGPIGDCAPAECPQHGATIFAQLGAQGWAGYDEAMPAPCDPITSGAYAARHNPAVYFAAIYPACRRDDLPLSDLPAVLAAGRLPAFTWITPDLCDDMHSCPEAAGDRWLSRWLPLILASSDYRTDRTAVFCTWDESSASSPTNQVALFVIAPSVPAGSRVGVPADHFSLLRTTEELLGLPPLGSAARAAPLVAGFGL
jgi:hypothetical protein